MNNLKVPLLHFFILFATFSVAVSQDISTKGALIIASVEGQVTVTNNESQQPLPAAKIVAGGVIYDGHTIKTGPSAKMILLLTNGTVATIKADSSLNIKKFTQEKFDMSKTNINDLSGEPSKSDTVIDIEIGDMVVDVKKLDKKSSFNIESPVGTAGIRGTVPAISVTQTPDGGFQQNTSMLRGEIAFTPRGGGLPTMLGPGQSLSSGIGPNGVMLPMQFGQVSAAMMTAIQADVEAAGEAMGISVDGSTDASDASVPASEEDAPSEDELNESDDEREGASKGVGDDDNGTDAVALDKAGLIDLDDPEDLAKADSYVEVTGIAATTLEEKVEQRRSGRRSETSEKDDATFLTDLTSNLDDVVDVSIEAEAIGVKSDAMFDSLLESSENAADVKEVVAVAAEIGANDAESIESVFINVDQADAVKEVMEVASDLGAQDAENLTAVFSNADKADDLKAVMDVATETLGSDDGTGTKVLDSSSASILSSTLQNADKADSMKEVMEVASDLGAQDAENLTAVFSNADMADDLKAVMDVAKETLGSDDGSGTKVLDSGSASILASTLQNADKADSMKEVMEVAADLGAQDAANMTSVFQNADKAADLKAVMDVAKATLGSDDGSGTNVLDASNAANLTSVFQNADKASDLKEVMEVAADLGAQDATNMTSVFQNADKAADLKAVMDVAKATLGTDDGSGSGTNKLDASNAANLTSVFQNADKASDLKEVMTAAADVGITDAANLTSVFQNADQASDLKDVMEDAKALATTGDTSLFTSVMQNADQAASVKKVVEAAKSGGASANIDNVLRNASSADKLSELVDKTSSSGTVNVSLLDTVLENADMAEDLYDVVDAAETSGGESFDVTSLLENADKADKLKTLVEAAQTSGGADSDTLLTQVFNNADQAEDLAAVIVEAQSSGTTDSVKALLNNADQAESFKASMDKAKSEGGTAKLGTLFSVIEKVDASNQGGTGDAANAAKALESLDALVSVAETLSGGDSEMELGAGFDAILNSVDDVEQIATALSEDTSLVTRLSASDLDAASFDIGSEVAASAFTKLQDQYEAGDPYLTIIQSNEARADDLQFALNHPALKIKATDSAEEITRKQGLQNSFLDNVDKIDDLLEIKKVLGEDADKITTVYSNLENIADLKSVTSNLRFDEDKLDAVYNNISNLAEYRKLSDTFIDDPRKLDAVFDTANQANVATISELVDRLDPQKGQHDLVFNNLEYVDDILSITNRFDGTQRDSILESVQELSFNFKNDPEKQRAIFDNAAQVESLSTLYTEFRTDLDKLDVIFENADKADAFLNVYNDLKDSNFEQLFTDPSSTLENEGLAKLKSEYDSRYHSIFDENSEIAAEIAATAFKFREDPEKLDQVFSNIDKLQDINEFSNDFAGDRTRIDIFFNNLNNLDELKKFKSLTERVGLSGGAALDLYDQDPAYLSIAETSPRYLEKLVESGVNLTEVPYTLALELEQLSLTTIELKEVLADLLAGPQVDGPTSAPPAQSGQQASSDTATLSFLMDHVIPSQEDQTVDNVVFLNPNKVVDYSEASSSSFFQESIDLYFELSDLDSDDLSASTIDAGYMAALEDSEYFVGGVFGGRNISFNQASYDLSNLESSNLLVAASGTLSLDGNLNFQSKLVKGESAELIFMSLDQLSISEGSAVSFAGDSLGFGSLDSIEVINVDLYAEGEVNMRSLDSLVINDSDMSTSGNGGADFVHLLAASELSINNLRFSEQVRQIAMEAMTINLSNLNFPAGSTVQLNSLYGGMDGSYPNFGAKQYGRVNFIQNVQYNSNLINSRTAFDKHGGNISIGSLR